MKYVLRDTFINVGLVVKSMSNEYFDCMNIGEKAVKLELPRV